MGHNSSLPKSEKRRKSLRSSSRGSTLSHAFTPMNTLNEPGIEQININLATEEELMTLEGVDRDTARSIISHRRRIGRFRKVEDLVVCLGASNLQRIQPEICVRSRNFPRKSSSFDSVLLPGDLCRVNLNKASIFDIQGIRGVTQEVAASISEYRRKKGPFKKVEDLLKIKQIDQHMFETINRNATLLDDEPTDNNNGSNGKTHNGPNIISNGNGFCYHNTYTQINNNNNNHIVKSLRMPSKSNGLSKPNILLPDIMELLSAYSPRPILEEVFQYQRDGKLAIRLATWNLDGFTLDKAMNFGVKEVVCRTILENGYSIIALQDVYSDAALKAICDELNNPKLHKVKQWDHSDNHQWNFCMLDVPNSNLAFIYDSDNGAFDIELIALKEAPKDTQTECDVLIGSFKVAHSTVLHLVNMAIQNTAQMDTISTKMDKLLAEEQNEMVALFSNNIQQTVKGLKPIKTPNCTNSNSNLDSIFVNDRLSAMSTNRSGRVHQGLTHLAIPCGWSWGGAVSSQAPQWAEFRLQPAQSMESVL